MPAKLLAALLALLLLLSGCSSATKPALESLPALPAESRTCSQRTTDEIAVGDWFAAQAVPLTSVTPGAEFDDLQPLKQMLKGVRVVGLGEGTHGTHEFTTIRHRLFEYLVREMGFRYFAVEASYSAALKIDDYIQTGEGNPVGLLRGLNSWPFTTAEMLDLIKWMRAYNETVAPDKRLHYVGVDVQTGDENYVRLLAFLAKVDPAYLAENGEFLRRVATWANLSTLKAQEQAVREDELRRLKAIHAHMVINQQKYAAVSSPAEATAALLQVRNLVGIYDTYVVSQEVNGAAVLKRDRYMADMALDQLSLAGPNARMVLIAHNYHVSKLQGFMGSHLRGRLGSGYYAFELLFGSGSFRAIDGQSAAGLLPFTVEAASADHLEWHLDCAGLHNVLVDYRSSHRSATVQRWLDALHNQRVIGALYDPAHPEQASGAVSPLKWDGLIYVLRSSPSSNVSLLGNTAGEGFPLPGRHPILGKGPILSRGG